VPVGRRNLLADRRRLIASILGVGLAVMLILLLDGMWAGIQKQATAYTDHAGADLYVLQPGIRDLTGGVSMLPMSTLDAVRADPTVSWAAPIRTAFVILQLHGRKAAVYVVGSVPGQPGGPWSLASGRLARADGEIVVGQVVAKRHGTALGDQLDIMGHPMKVVGVSRTTGFMFDYVFVTHSAFGRMSATPQQTSAILVGTTAPNLTAAHLRADGLHVLTRTQVATNDRKIVAGIFESPIRLMVAIGLIGGTLIIALTAYTAIIERRREYGIVKALGARTSRLVRLAVGQTLALSLMGLLAGVLLFVAGRTLIAETRPQFSIVLTTGGITRAALAAVVMALVAAVIPARRLAKLDPAVAYRSAS
jgi:putative ABC transport system permease protein